LEVKIAAMALSKTERISSTEAFRLLGIPIDSRDYSLAVEAMRELGVPTRIAAVTANMGKVKALKNAGFQVVKLIQNAENLSQHHQKMTWSRRCRYRQRVQPFCDV
jgi:GTP cyclohydrolase II